MDTGVATLQNTINRFAVVGGFPRVDVDGLWGSQTKQGVRSTLYWIGQGKCYQTACVIPEDSHTAAGLITQWDESMTAARGLAEFFGRIANDLGIPLVAAPVPSGGGAPGPIVNVPPAFQVSLVDRFKLLPLWQQVAMGLVTGLGLIFVVNKLRARHQPPQRRRGA